MDKLERIVKLDAEISNLEVLRDRLGAEYAKENFPFKIGDKITVSRKVINGDFLSFYQDHYLIINITYGKHSKLKGLARLWVDSIMIDGTPYTSQRHYMSDENIKEITEFKVTEI